MPRPLLALFPLAAGLLLAGCAESTDQTYSPVDDHGHDDEHVHAAADHGHEGPHGGILVELTADHSIHGEIVMDADDPARGKFYVLGAGMQPIAADSASLFFDAGKGPDAADGEEEVNLKLAPADDAAGETLAWSFLRARLPEGGEPGTTGTARVIVDGETYTGPFSLGEEHDHDHDEHDHGDHDDHDHGDHDHD